MDKMSKWIVKYRNMILAVAIVLLIPSAIGYFNTNINYDLLFNFRIYENTKDSWR